MEEYRKQIDEIDKKILALLEERLNVAGEIGKYKDQRNLPITDYLREKRLLSKIVEGSKPEFAMYNKILFSTIMEISKEHQRRVTSKESNLIKTIENAVENGVKALPDTATVACQGVEGAYSAEACEKLFKNPKIMYLKNFKGVFAAIENGLCQYGILPIENSTAGSVNQIYDLMIDYDFHIVKSIRVKIDHNLLGKAGMKKENVKRIYSHEQAIAQCDEYLKTLGDVEIIVCENTAEAAKLVSLSSDGEAAALASFAAARMYGLTCIEEAVQDKDNNYTRFICISKNLEVLAGADRTSLRLVLDHKPGALYNVLSRFNAMGINLLKLESRPLPKREFEFMFYFDIQCSIYSKEFTSMIGQLEEMSREFTYLGSYMEV